MKKRSSKKNNSVVGFLILIILILASACVYFVLKGNGVIDKTNTDKKTSTSSKTSSGMSVKKVVETNIFYVILDKDGNVYLDLKEDKVDKSSKINELFDKASTYTYNGKTEKLVKVDVDEIVDIQALKIGKGYYYYITMLDKDNKLYTIIDTDAEKNGSVGILINSKLTNVSKVYNDCNNDECKAMVEVNKNDKINLQDIFEDNSNSSSNNSQNTPSHSNPDPDFTTEDAEDVLLDYFNHEEGINFRYIETVSVHNEDTGDYDYFYKFDVRKHNGAGVNSHLDYYYIIVDKHGGGIYSIDEFRNKFGFE